TDRFTSPAREIDRVFGDTARTRIEANIEQGIGLLGAGAILREAGGRVGMTTAATIFMEPAIGMASGGGLFAVATYTTALVLFGLVCLGWGAQRFDLKSRPMVFRFTTSHAESVATEVQPLMAQMKVPMQHFLVSMAGGNSIVEFELVVSHTQQERIVAQLSRQG